jgi:Polyketide cyclase / dehydrase and lipid transport
MATEGDPIPITYLDGPSEPMCLADQPGTYVEAHVDAPPSRVWELVVDLDMPARFSTEFLGARWVDGGPAVGARFIGRNRHPAIGDWEVPSFVDVYDEGTAFGWATVDAANPGSRWRFDVRPEGDGTCLRYSMSMGPGPSGITAAITAMPEKEARILQRRIAEHHANMRRTVEGIAALAALAAPGHGREPA